MEAAVGNKRDRKEVMTLLFKQRGNEVKITEQVVKAAAGNWLGWHFSLEQRRVEVKITEEVVKVAGRI